MKLVQVCWQVSCVELCFATASIAYFYFVLEGSTIQSTRADTQAHYARRSDYNTNHTLNNNNPIDA